MELGIREDSLGCTDAMGTAKEHRHISLLPGCTSDCGLELVWRITWVIAQPWPVSGSWQPGYSDTNTSLVQTQGFAAHAFCQSQGSVFKSRENLDSCRQGSLLEKISCFSILHHVTQHVTDNDLLHLDTMMPESRDHCSIRSSV